MRPLVAFNVKSNELAACLPTVAVADPQLFARGLEYKPWSVSVLPTTNFGGYPPSTLLDWLTAMYRKTVIALGQLCTLLTESCWNVCTTDNQEESDVLRHSTLVLLLYSNIVVLKVEGIFLYCTWHLGQPQFKFNSPNNFVSVRILASTPYVFHEVYFSTQFTNSFWKTRQILCLSLFYPYLLTSIHFIE